MIENEFESEVKEEIELKRPKMYKVLLLNDDYTSMEFVVSTLMNIFHKSEEDAYTIMLRIHNSGSGLCGVYTNEIAETKVAQVLNSAKKNKFPLRAVMEEE
ncbi:ATP-dependent Clp protease adapter ClpS [Sulfurospirillum arcachonense]|uniref:ATP-dependent Clp protease adapter ClpS n=1 Tax=Sulfurospirillum arcachonense TaxID=57666 RepID=UPI0004AEA863|nr:ATP-dependent Clp protease adapter ClpS [Sulfurospirillum arcachonense]